MSFDSSRFTFRPRRNFLGVVMQQGRVQLDSDWNEWQSEYNRRIQAGTVDAFGQAVYPSTTPEAFKITASTDSSGVNHITIGAGRYYVDGLLAENHGPESQAAWDTALGEMSGSPIDSTTAAATDYTQQPYLPGATLPTTNGPWLAYLDVWQRDVTYLEDPYLVDPAVGVDTTGRLQAVWQVKLLDVSSISGVDCSTDVSAFDALFTPPAGQLTNGLVPSATSGPCCLAPNTGYTGLENQLYRVEIHNGGTVSAPPSGGFTYPLPSGTPTFKWSRDNASVATTVSAIATVTVSGSSVSQLTVASLGRDQVLGFAVNDWIEITDDAHELNGQPGETYQITGITPSTNTITLNGAVSSAFPLTNGQTTPSLHTRIIKWNQSGQVSLTDSSGNLTPWIDLNSPGSTGVIPVPPAGSTLVLENGITVAFGLNPATGSFNTADYWTFAARTADGTIQPLSSAPTAGIHHHYAKLAIVTLPSTATDCRAEWPPSASGCCECTVTVAPGDITGNTTLQSIFDKYQNQNTGTTICLAPGTYSLLSPLRLTSAHNNITLEACQPGTVTIQALAGNEATFTDGVIVLDGSDAITLSGLDFIVPVAPFSASTFAGMAISSIDPDVASVIQSLAVSIGVRMVGTTDIAIENCVFQLKDVLRQKADVTNQSSFSFGAGIFASGENEGFTLQGSQFFELGSFSAGFLLVPSVSVAPPPAPAPTPAPAPAPPGGLTGVVSGAPTAGTIATEAAKSGALKAREEVLNLPINKQVGPTLSISSGTLQNILNLGTSVSNLAANGGAIVPATIDEAVFRNNSFVDLTAAVLILGESGQADFLANQVLACTSGFSLINPTQASFVLSTTFTTQLEVVGLAISMGYPLPQGDTSSIVTVAAVPSPIRIYTGLTNYTDSAKNVWVPDANSGATISAGSSVSHPSPPPTITGTSDPTLYQSERYGTFSYTFSNLPAGYYTVTLLFAEIFYNAAGKRLFDVSINGQQVLTDFDIFADAGGEFIADNKVYANVAPNSAGQIVIQFTGTTDSPDHNAKISAVEIVPQWTGTPTLGSSEAELPNFFDQLSQLAQQGYANIGFSPAQLRVDDNEMHDLQSTALLILDDDSIYNQNSSSLMMTSNRLDNLGSSTVLLAQNLTDEAAQNRIDLSKTDVATQVFEVNTNQLATEEVSAIAVGAREGFLVGILQVSRCVLSANMLTTGTPGNGYTPSLVLDDLPVQQAELAVMGNVFTGRVLIEPERNLNNTNIPPAVATWEFLNTIITG